MKQLSFRSFFFVLIALLIACTTHANCLDSARLTGVNLAGAEFNTKNLPGVVFKDYTYPKATELAFIAAQGANVIRLPFRWERLQRELNGPLDAAELKRLQTTIDQAKAQGLCVLLDVHNYAKYYGEPMTTAPLQNGFVAFWIALAAQMKDAEYVAFGLMNEPAHMPLNDWAVLAKRTLSELRKAGAQNLILVGGGSWNGLHSWFKGGEGNNNAEAFAGLNDPLKRTVIEVHQYADTYYSGTKLDCYPPEHFDSKFERIGQWAKDNQLQLFLGEFGMATTAPCLATLDRFLKLMAGSEWKGWTYWAAGGWWGTYAFALNSSATEPSPQWSYLKTYFYREPDISRPLPPENATQ